MLLLPALVRCMRIMSNCCWVCSTSFVKVSVNCDIWYGCWVLFCIIVLEKNTCWYCFAFSDWDSFRNLVYVMKFKGVRVTTTRNVLMKLLIKITVLEIKTNYLTQLYWLTNHPLLLQQVLWPVEWMNMYIYIVPIRRVLGGAGGQRDDFWAFLWMSQYAVNRLIAVS